MSEKQNNRKGNFMSIEYETAPVWTDLRRPIDDPALVYQKLRGKWTNDTAPPKLPSGATVREAFKSYRKKRSLETVQQMIDRSAGQAE